MKKALLLLAAACAAAIALSACQGGAPTSSEQYQRNHDRYMGSLEPKTGRAD